jgi:teichuronic acid biosynthesis glycosyltransferase TuaG
MKVSIITPSYNSAGFIGETIRAIREQSWKDWELLVTDDCSTDDTRQVVAAFADKDERIRLFALPENSGADIARNHSIGQATGRFIAFCDSDDLWTPDKLEKQIAFMLENNYAFTFAPYYLLNEEGRKTGISPARPKVSYKDLLLTCDIGCLTAVYDTEKLGKQYMPAIRKSHDYALWLKILKQIDFAYSYPAPLGYYRVRSHSVSRNKLHAMRYNWKVYREVEKIPFLRSLAIITVYSFYNLWRYARIRLNAS